METADLHKANRVRDSGRVVGNPYLGITSGLPVTRPQSAPSVNRIRHYPYSLRLVPLPIAINYD